MKKILFCLFASGVLLGCSSDDTSSSSTSDLIAQNYLNVPYGEHPEQTMDVYLPAGRTSQTKVFVIVHGGYWVEGDKEDMNYIVGLVQSSFPDHAIVNINYRLASLESPGFPKQIEDVGLALDQALANNYTISDDMAFIGASAGAHLSLLYAYGFDPEDRIKAVCSIVGPTDFTDPAYVNDPNFQMGLYPLVGPVPYTENPALYASVSPVNHVSSSAPPTIQLCAGQDELIPVSQGSRLQQALDESGVYNEYYLYPTASHGSWSLDVIFDMQVKLTNFFEERF